MALRIVIEAEPEPVINVTTHADDEYESIQVGFDDDGVTVVLTF